MKKLVSLVLSLGLICSLSVSAFAAPVLKGFRDVSPNHWAYSAIMDMTSNGLFAGTTTPDENGMGTFSPDNIMTRAQFITVVSRALFGSEIRKPVEGEYWYTPNWESLVEYYIIEENDFGGVDELDKPISREEMAYIISNTLSIVEGIPEVLEISEDEVPDFYAVEPRYTEEVLACYSMGIICGVDSQGTFSPKGAVTRAQGATILYRMVKPDVRVEVEVEAPKPIIDVTDNSDMLYQNSFDDYNDRIVTGTMVKAAVQNYEGKSVAILVNTKAMDSGVATYDEHSSTHYLSISNIYSNSDVGIKSGSVKGGSSIDNKFSDGHIYVNYNAILDFSNSKIDFKDGNYLIENAPFAIDNTTGQFVFDNNTEGVRRTDNCEYLKATSKFDAHLMQDEMGIIIGIVFTERT